MELGIAATSIGGGFFGGIVIGYTLKKVAKVIAIFYHLFGRNKQTSILTGLKRCDTSTKIISSPKMIVAEKKRHVSVNDLY